jgi:hypothetical protein
MAWVDIALRASSSAWCICFIVMLGVFCGGALAMRAWMHEKQIDDDEDELRSYVHSRRAGGPRRRGLAAMGPG